MKHLNNLVTYLIITCSLLAPCNANAWEVRHKDQGKYTLLRLNQPIGQLAEVIRAEHGQLETLAMGRIVDFESSTIQSEIMQHLKLNVPDLLHNALSSAGNMHNPKVTALRDSFNEALNASSYIKTISDILEPLGYSIAGISFEKFHIYEASNTKILDATVWLDIELLTR